MNREQIIQIAEQCGIPEFENNESQAENIIRFAALVAAAEREACAQILDGVDSYANPMTANDCADAIRARGNNA